MAAKDIKEGQKTLIHKDDVKSQEDFNFYIDHLPDSEKCFFMTGIELELCSDLRFQCQFRGEDTYSLSSGMCKECRRQRVMKLKKLFSGRKPHIQPEQ